MDPTTDPGMSPMRISDAAAMLRRRINPNERPYAKTVQQHNNKIVDEWYSSVLLKIADKTGNIRAGQVFGEWRFFYDGKLVSEFIKAYEAGYIERPAKDKVDYWIATFTKKPIEDLAEMGPMAIGHGWKLVTDETFIRSNLNKWELVYKGSSDPLVWRKNAHNNPKLWAVDYDSPFWDLEELKDITQKVMTVLKLTIEPEK